MSEIGYGKPPKNTRFQKGNREHLKRKKKADKPIGPNFLARFLQRKVTYREGGKVKRDPLIVVWIKRLGTDALKGDVAAADQLLKMRKQATEIGEVGPIILDRHEALTKSPDPLSGKAQVNLCPELS